MVSKDDDIAAYKAFNAPFLCAIFAGKPIVSYSMK
jgi:hypothetical protein